MRWRCVAGASSTRGLVPRRRSGKRSRYSAYVLRRVLYLRESWHPRTRPRILELDEAEWLGLQVVGAHTLDADHATVEFVARFRRDGLTHTLREHSRFERRRGAWVYVDAF